MGSVATLRAVANRLTKSGDDLPNQVGYLASALGNCQDALQSSTSNSDIAVIVHKLKTRTSALLQDRTPAARLCGIVIAKALVEAGGHAVLSESGSWVRNLISCLNKPDTPEVKQLCISTITRTYLLTADDQQMVREITTPTLPAFMTACLSNIKPTITEINGTTMTSLSPLLRVVLRSWCHLMRCFASTIRPNAASMKSICLSLIGDPTCNAAVQRAAEDVLARLHYCAPRNTVATEWSQMCLQAIEAAHDTADIVFRAVVEDWKPNVSHVSKVTKKQRSAGVPAMEGFDVLGLPGWTGISEGCQRLAALISLIRTLSTSSHSQEIELPLASILDLTARLSDVLPPTSKYTLRNNNEVTRDEREELWLNVPRIHAQVLNLLNAFVTTLSKAMYPVCSLLSQQMWDILDAEHANAIIREHSYQLVQALLQQNALTITKSDSKNLRQLASCCCNDLLPESHISSTQGQEKAGTSVKKSITRLTLDKKETRNKGTIRAAEPCYDAAYDLLPTLISQVAWHKLVGGQSVRARLDSTAIFLQHHQALLASVLNPPRSSSSAASATPSLLPFLARAAHDTGTSSTVEALATEALLRPRMPAAGKKPDLEIDDGVEDESMQDDIETNGLDEPSETKETSQSEQESSSARQKETIQHVENELATSSNLQKRDFTSLLEESADAQLAASGETKKQKTELDFESLPKPANSRQEFRLEAQTEQPDKPEREALISNTSVPERASETLLVDKANTSADVMDESEYSSDDSIPPIDATLNTFSDSEDDEDDDERT